MPRGVKRLVGNLELRVKFARARLDKLNTNMANVAKRFPNGHPDQIHIKTNIETVEKLIARLVAQIEASKTTTE